MNSFISNKQVKVLFSNLCLISSVSNQALFIFGPDSSLCIFISFLQSVEMANVQALDSVLIVMQECISAVLLQGV